MANADDLDDNGVDANVVDENVVGAAPEEGIPPPLMDMICV